MTRIVTTSDLHGFLPEILPCDILIIAGDICGNSDIFSQMHWLDTKFRYWLDSVPAKHVVGVWGNHDLIAAKHSHLIPIDLKWHCLRHNLIEIEGFKIFGMPWILPIWGAFQREETELERLYEQIPDDVDIIISHGPPYGIGDSAHGSEHCGSTSLRKRLFDIKPLICVTGHVHENRDIFHEQDFTVINASLMDANFKPTNKPIVIDVNEKQIKIVSC